MAFQKAISALQDVVVSDLRFKPKDKTAYKEWRAKQDEINWELVGKILVEAIALRLLCRILALLD